jgi:hypothetical protein
MSQWIEKIFSAKIATEEGVVRRKKTSVERYATLDDLIAAVKKRKFHLIETGDQYVIVCNTGAVKIVV